MDIDLQYLLFLQMIRNMLGGSLDEFLNAVSKFTVTIMPILPYVMFWSVDKRKGYQILSVLWGGEMTNGLMKLTVCAYRPWIRSDLIEPAGDSKVAATGYSFPSGHTMVATATYGTAAVWEWMRRRWVSIVCIFLIFLTMFSRNFLGVHTPQDVLAGIIETIIIIFIVFKSTKFFSGNRKRQDILTFAGVPFVILSLLYITQKSYPMDYVNGVLLVNPQVMMNDMFKSAGGFTGLLIASYIERHYIHYEIPTGYKNLALLTWVGGALIYGWYNLMLGAVSITALGGHWGNFVGALTMVIFGVAVYPVFIRKIVKSDEEKGLTETVQEAAK